MKKLTLIIMLATLATGVFAQDLKTTSETSSPLSAALTVGYESQYVFRGLRQGDGIVTANVNTVIADRISFDLLALAPMARDVKMGAINEVDATLKYIVPVENASFDFGGILYTYPRSKVSLKETQYTVEPFVALRYKAFLNPSVAAYYDVNMRTWSFEGSVNESIKLFGNFSLVPSIHAGYVDAKDAEPEAVRAVKRSYRYADGALDLVYALGDHASLSVGERYVVSDNVEWTRHAWTGASFQLKF